MTIFLVFRRCPWRLGVATGWVTNTAATQRRLGCASRGIVLFKGLGPHHSALDTWTAMARTNAASQSLRDWVRILAVHGINRGSQPMQAGSNV